MSFQLGVLFQVRRIVRLGALVLVGAAVLLVGASSDARPPVIPFPSTGYAVRLEDDAGNPLRVFRHEGTTFVLGFRGERYNVRIENPSDVRVEAVLSVDGRDAVSGEMGDYVRSRGYVVPPHGSILVSGFRKNLDDVAAFRFSAPSASYSARMGTPENVGVIGVAFFPERRPRRAIARPDGYDHYRGRSWGSGAGRGTTDAEPRAADRPSPAPAAAAPSKSAGASAASGRGSAAGARDDLSRDGAERNRLGTEYGETTWSPVTEVPFQRENPSYPALIVSVRYDDAEGLMARGIEVYPRPFWPTSDAPEPFPRNRFAPPPP
jgi:hypothetical protein